MVQNNSMRANTLLFLGVCLHFVFKCAPQNVKRRMRLTDLQKLVCHIDVLFIFREPKFTAAAGEAQACKIWVWLHVICGISGSTDSVNMRWDIYSLLCFTESESVIIQYPCLFPPHEDMLWGKVI